MLLFIPNLLLLLFDVANADNGKPVIVIVPGAWTTAEQFAPVISSLQSKGYTAVANTLPSINSTNPSADTIATDAEFYREGFFCPLIDGEGKDVILMTHSYGGVPGNIAIQGLSKVERAARGQKGGVIGMILLASFTLKEGQALITVLPNGEWLPWWQGQVRAHVSSPPFEDVPVIHVLTSLSQNNKQQISISTPKPTFFNDVDDATAAPFIVELGWQSYSTFTSLPAAPAWADNERYTNRRVYIKTLRDTALDPVAQDGLREGTDVAWNLKTIDSGHCPFSTQPDNLAQMVVDSIEGFQKLGPNKRRHVRKIYLN